MKETLHSIPAVAVARDLIPADSARSITRSAVPEEVAAIERIFAWANRLSDAEVEQRLGHLREHFTSRGDSMDAAWQKSFERASPRRMNQLEHSPERQLYIGSLFSHEFPIESLGLLNPGLIHHADQSGMSPGSARFFLVADGIGNDRTSSMVFREGIVDKDYAISFGEMGCMPCAPEPVTNPILRRTIIFRHLHEIGFDNAWTRTLMQSLGDEFSRSELLAVIDTAAGPTRNFSRDSKASIECLRWLSEANYAMTFEDGSVLSDRVLLPSGSSGRGGLHEGCFTLFDEEPAPRYLAACMSCNGQRSLPLLLESRDLIHFTVSLLGGGASRCRGMAIFPRKFSTRYAAIAGRSDDSIYLMYSENPAIWEIAAPVKSPAQPWESLGIRPCGAPIATGAGWLVIYRAVGEMGSDAIGAMLLHRDDPSQLLGYLKQPLLAYPPMVAPGTSPNILTSRGALVHGDRLLIAYTVHAREVEVAQFELGPLLRMLLS